MFLLIFPVDSLRENRYNGFGRSEFCCVGMSLKGGSCIGALGYVVVPLRPAFLLLCLVRLFYTRIRRIARVISTCAGSITK